MTRSTRILSATAVLAIASILYAGCGPSKGNPTSTSGGGGAAAAPAHFTSLKAADPNGVSSVQLISGARTNNEGLVFWPTITTTATGNTIKAEVIVYFGPYGGDDNTLAPGNQPYLFPNYDQGAENGKLAADYAPIRLELMAGGGNQLWKGTINRFPTNGRFLFTITKNGNSLTNTTANAYMQGLMNDSSFDNPKSSLTAFYDSANRKIRLP